VNEATDQQLLDAYTGRRSEAAFAELVRRHVDLVYSAARRMVRDPDMAKDVTQAVFLALAKQAGKLAGRPVLAGWLHRAALTLRSFLAVQRIDPGFHPERVITLGLALPNGRYPALGQRTREIGLRMALGARRNDVVALVLRDGGRLAALGILIGTMASLGAAWLLASQIDLYQVAAIDPVSFLGVILVLGLVAAAACYLPARRASRVDPMEALRNE
jgi:FtsX-like permease family/Sigma-70 region 2